MAEDEIKAIEDNKMEGLYKLQKMLQNEFNNYSLNNDLLQRFNEEIKKKLEEYKAEISNIYRFFIEDKNEPNLKIRNLFEKSVKISETSDIIDKARIRKEKGNPPYSNSLGDAIIWESILSFLDEELNKVNFKIDLIFISNDRKAWGKDQFDRFLEEEYKNRIGGDIFYSNKLSDILNFTTEEQKLINEKIKREIEELQQKIKKAEIEELKRNAIVDFLASPSFIEAGNRAEKLLQFKEYLTQDDYKMIIRGSLSNPQIYQSYFCPPVLLELVKGEDEYVVEQVEFIDIELWKQFADKFSISLKRKSDEKL